ncbi:MAE_28990/MAE_18760 family HEPN-like nuclease [Streptomyces albidoflavus]|uniref:MAE_28990/MAE_18760 family HEPN-like nuclease n=1 Tax=Streptomyces albidoflavus TaxID=1886 RepID=UPI003D17E0D8
MAPHEKLVEEIHLRADRFLRRVDDLKNFLALVTGVPQGSGIPRWASESRDARALAIVCVMAEMESFTKYFIQETHAAINSSSVKIGDLRPSLRQLAAHAAFESLRELNDHGKLWERRKYATTLDSCAEPVELPVNRKQAQPPLDGKTLKPEHFNRLWEIYGIPGISFPFATWGASLQKLAMLRNDVAHGNIPYVEVFQQAGVAVSDIERYVDDVVEFLIHLVDSWCLYLSGSGYLKSP